jgi:acyl-CoA thioester hydrolase
VVNNAAYLTYFEVGRVESLRAAGLSYRELEERGFGFVVTEALLRYRKPARFDDHLTVRATLAEAGRASLRFEYEILRGEELLVTGHTRHACMDLSTRRPGRVPLELLAILREPQRSP